MKSSPYLKQYYKARKSLSTTVQRLFLLLLFTNVSLTSCVYSKTSSYNFPITPQNNETNFDNNYMQIKLLGSIALSQNKFNSIPILELSGIAWDQDEQLLYAVSDEGLLYHLKLTFKDKQIKDMQVVYATSLKNKDGNDLKGKYKDSEGLALAHGNNGIAGDSTLIISFENKPRIAKYTPTGKFLSKVKIPKKLRKRKSYRHKNKALESVTTHPEYGILTASEYPLKKDDLSHQSLYSSSGNIWHFKASAADSGAITGLETLPNGDILLLERAYKNPLVPVSIHLRRLKLDHCKSNKECKTEIIASFDGSDGWILDNFEGLAHVKDNKYLVISDNNDNPLQHTILVFFEINADNDVGRASGNS